MRVVTKLSLAAGLIVSSLSLSTLAQAGWDHRDRDRDHWRWEREHRYYHHERPVVVRERPVFVERERPVFVAPQPMYMAPVQQGPQGLNLNFNIPLN